jgi:hypothetical protein
MHLAREGGAEHNEAMKNYCRVMFGAGSLFASTHIESNKLKKKHGYL